jgi:type II secretory pathway pseudopilin PulG
LATFPWVNDTWGNGSNIELIPTYVTPATMVFRVLLNDPDGYLSAMDDLQAAAIQPYYLIKDKLPNSDDCRLGILAQIVFPSLDGSLKANARMQANDACARTAIAMTRYRLDHGSLPTRLAALVPNYVDAIPTDPFNGQPLRLVIKNNEWIIYSVGPNGIDDNGVGNDKTHKTKDDVAFTLKATPASATTKQ